MNKTRWSDGNDSPLRPWRLLSQAEVFSAQPWLRVLEEAVRLPDGAIVEPFYRVEALDYTVIYPVMADGNVLCVRHYKHGPRRVALGLPAGYLQRGEEPLAGAQRELLEESGCKAANWHALGTFTVDGNRGAGLAHIFRADGVERVTEPNSGDHEETLLLTLSPDALRAALFGGEFASLGPAAGVMFGLLAGADTAVS